ncbi:MAG: MFS transporter [Lachnospiraceae bacterium]
MKTKISMREKLAYGLGDSACNLVWATIMAFLTIYYTDNVGIAAGVVGTMMLVTRLLDGGSDLIMGVIIDKTNTKYGKARIWVLLSAPMMAIGLILLFNVPESLSMTGKTVYAYVTYIFIAAVAFTACNLAYTTLLGLMTDSPSERTSISSIRMMFANGTGMLLAVLTPIIVKQMGYGKISWIYAGIAFVFLLITFAGTKERVKVQKEKDSASLPVKESLKMLIQNKYFLRVTIIFLLNYTANNLCNGAAVFYASYILGKSTYFGIIAIGMTLPIILLLPTIPGLVKKFGRCKVMIVGMIIQVAAHLFVFFVARDIITVMIGMVVIGIGRTAVASNQFALVGDVVDFGEWKTGVRLDGITNSITSFGMKVGTGLGAAGVGWILAAGAYAPNTEQNATAMLAIRAAFSLIPLIIVAINAVILMRCKLDKEQPQIIAELTERRTKM